MADIPCTSNPDLFFPESGNYETKAKCAGCPVRTECLQMELSFMRANPDAETHGMWGGTTPRERRRMILAGARPRWVAA